MHTELLEKTASDLSPELRITVSRGSRLAGVDKLPTVPGYGGRGDTTVADGRFKGYKTTSDTCRHEELGSAGCLNFQRDLQGSPRDHATSGAYHQALFQGRDRMLDHERKLYKKKSTRRIPTFPALPQPGTGT